MPDFQKEKRLVRDYYEALDSAQGDAIIGVLRDFTSPHYVWRAFHPFNLQTSVDTVGETFWKPFRNSIRHMQRRMDVFFAGKNSNHRSCIHLKQGGILPHSRKGKLHYLQVTDGHCYVSSDHSGDAQQMWAHIFQKAVPHG